MIKLTDDLIPYIVGGFVVLLFIWPLTSPGGKQLLEAGMYLLLILLGICLVVNLLARVINAIYEGDQR